MNTIKPSILPGFLELLPQEQIVFNKILDSIRKTYENFGFMPLDTPVIEKSEVLLAKGGGETEKQIYRFTKGDTDMSLRFDLTVPLARYVAQHSSELTFPFRRYQIGKVFRGERNQKGRFREFYQCDIDIVGTNELSLVNDAEIISVIYTTFKALGFMDFTIRVSNRKILQGLLNTIGVPDKISVLRIIDKLEKIGQQNITQELNDLGLNHEDIERTLALVELRGNNDEVLARLDTMGIDDVEYKQGLTELKQVIEAVKHFKVPSDNAKIDLSITRGLDYYTGTVFETTLNNYQQLGSVCSGGRYDNLAEYYTTKRLPGVGASIGLTRLYYQLREAGFWGIDETNLVKVMVIPIGDVLNSALSLVSELRSAGIPAQLYAECGKLSKKLSYVNKQNIPFALILGDEEIQNGTILVRNMRLGEQVSVPLEQILAPSYFMET